MEALTKLIEAASHLIGALAWPTVFVVLAYRFSPAIGDFIRNINEGSFKGFGFEASAKKVFANIDAALKQKSTEGINTRSEKTADREANSNKIANLVTPEAFKRAFGRNILWVDDKPEGNRYERIALQELGYHIKISTNSNEALDLLKNGPSFDLIISDLSRPEGQLAGFEILEEIRSLNINLPFIIYTGTMTANTRESVREKAKQIGVFGCTGNAGKLIKLVLDATKYADAFK